MSNIIKEHLVECEAWRKTCEEHFDEALAQGCVPTLNNYSWVSWEKPPEFDDPYEAWDMGAEFARIMIKRQIEQQQAQLEAWEKLVNNYISGNSANPRRYRSLRCLHGKSYWRHCDCCDAEYFEAGIKRIKAMRDES